MVPREVDRRRQFGATCLPFTGKLYAAAVRLTRKPEDASDVVQETLLRAYRTFGGFETGTNARAWLFKILHTVFLNRDRKERRSSGWLPLDEVEDRLPHPGPRGDCAAAWSWIRRLADLRVAAPAVPHGRAQILGDRKEVDAAAAEGRRGLAALMEMRSRGDGVGAGAAARAGLGTAPIAGSAATRQPTTRS